MNHNITQVAERAVRAYLISRIDAGEIPWCPPTQVYRGIENREDQENEGEDSSVKIYPCIIAIVENASPVRPNWKGLWMPRLSLEVWSNRSLTVGDDHDARAAEAFSLFTTTTIAKDLSEAIEDFWVKALLPGQEGQGYRAIGRAWASFFHWDLIHACTFNKPQP